MNLILINFFFKCIDLVGKGFVLDAYNCKCKLGFYNNTNSNGSKSLSCLKCSEGCDTCIGEFKLLNNKQPINCFI